MLSGQSAAEWLTVRDLGRIGIHCDPHVGQSLLGVKASRCEVEDFLLRRTFFFFFNKALRKKVVTVVSVRLSEEEHVCGKHSCCNSKGQGI